MDDSRIDYSGEPCRSPCGRAGHGCRCDVHSLASVTVGLEECTFGCHGLQGGMCRLPGSSGRLLGEGTGW